MNRNLRVAQSAAHLQNGVLKAIHMNRNLKVAQSAATFKMVLGKRFTLIEI
jgi:hypothetical protein